MARIRSIKPEFFTSEQVAECSTTARLLFVGLWCFCDDGGVHVFSAKRIKMEVFPADDFSIDQVLGWLQELIVAGLLKSYVVGGQRFLWVTGWHHQKIERPSFKHPGPSKADKFDDHSTITLRTLIDESPPDGSRVESSRVESNGKEGSRDFSGEPEELAPPQPPADVAAFPCVGNSGQWTCPQAKVDEWRSCFPALDVLGEVRKARQWLLDNPGRRKTARGMTRFLFGWLERSQNKRGANGSAPRTRLPTPEEQALWNASTGGQ